MPLPAPTAFFLSSPFSIGFNHTVSKLMHLLITRNKIFGKICVDGKDLIFYDHLTCFQTSGDSIKKVRNKIKARRRQKSVTSENRIKSITRKNQLA